VKKIILFAAGILLITGACAFYPLTRTEETKAAAAGPLRVHPTNRRYFTDGSGRAIYLTGSHIWTNLQDRGEDPPLAFDYAAYLDFMQTRDHNFMRMWAWEGSMDSGTDGIRYYQPLPWARTGSGNAEDGKPKFDLSQFNQAYFDRLRSRVIQARDRGIYVSIMLFEGWSVEKKGSYAPCRLHPFNEANNVNGINADPDGDGSCPEAHTLDDSAITDRQRAYIRKVVDTLNDLDNVLYEISNEDGASGANTEWQYVMINYVKSYESGKPKQHPVGMTYQWPGGSDSTLFSSPADWISPTANANSPSIADGSKVILTDSDHPYFDGTVHWVWASFMRGLNPILMDNGIDAYQGYGPSNPNPAWEPTQYAMGHTLTYANKMNLAAMTPRGDLTSTGYALANPGSEYLTYNPRAGSFTVDLQPATYQIEWFNPSNGQTSSGGSVSGGGSHTFDPPFSGDTVLYLKGPGAGASPTLRASRSPMPSPSPTPTTRGPGKALQFW
jgi:hypothetical protein